MKTTKINGLKTHTPTVETKTEVKNIDGNIIEIQNEPQFDGPTVTVKGGTTKGLRGRNPRKGI